METIDRAREYADLRSLVRARFNQSMTIPERFFAVEDKRIAQVCWRMAQRFHKGGRLLAFGNGAGATDAQHVAVEFVHPVIVGKRALPALALTNDSATMSGLMAGGNADMPFPRLLKILARPYDIAMGFSADGQSVNVLAGLVEAQQMGLLTIGMAGADGGQMRQARLDYCFTVPSDDPLVIQETHETTYHILWELVHIFFEHEGLLT
jgi:D-sedoheptulose 7-phosphate isomerase